MNGSLAIKKLTGCSRCHSETRRLAQRSSYQLPAQHKGRADKLEHWRNRPLNRQEGEAFLFRADDKVVPIPRLAGCRDDRLIDHVDRRSNESGLLQEIPELGFPIEAEAMLKHCATRGAPWSECAKNQAPLGSKDAS